MSAAGVGGGAQGYSGGNADGGPVDRLSTQAKADAAHVMAVRMVIAIAARIIPTAVAGFGAMVFPFPGSKSAGFMGNNSEETA